MTKTKAEIVEDRQFENFIEELQWKARAEPSLRKALQLWSADCAAHALPAFEKERPSDLRVEAYIRLAREGAAAEDAKRGALEAVKQIEGYPPIYRTPPYSGLPWWMARVVAINAGVRGQVRGEWFSGWEGGWTAEREWQKRRLTACLEGAGL